MKFEKSVIAYIMGAIDENHLQLLKDMNDKTELLAYKDIRRELRPDWTQPMTDKIINRLLGTRFIQEVKDPKDKRNLFFEVTENGKNALSLWDEQG